MDQTTPLDIRAEPVVSEAFIAKAIEYATRRWLLDDPALVREYCEDRFQDSHTPESILDELAERYDLTDPRDFGLGIPERA